MKRIGVYFPHGLGNAIQFLPFIADQIKNGYEIFIFCKSKISFDIFTKFSNVSHLVLLNENKFSKVLTMRKYKFNVFIFAQIYNYQFKFFSYILHSKAIYCYDFKSYKFRFLTAVEINLNENEIYWPYRVFQKKDIKNNALKYPILVSKDTTQLPLKVKRKYLISIHLGCSAFYVHKRWSLSNYIKIVAYILRGFDAQILLIGSMDDVGITNKLKSNFINDNVINAVPSFDISKTLSYINQSDLFISGDTGLMHLAACTPTPQIVLFDNSTFFGKNIPVTSNKIIRILGSVYKSVDEIKIKEVQKAITNVLQGNY